MTATIEVAVVARDDVVRLVELARSFWPSQDGQVPSPLPGFVGSSFAPLVAHVAGTCLTKVYGRPPADIGRGDRTAVVLVTVRGDLSTSAAVASAIDESRRIPPLLFFSSVPNAVAGAVAATWGLRGPLVVINPVGDPASDAIELAGLLIEDGDTDEVLLIRVEQACLDGESDRAVATLLAHPRACPSERTSP